MYERAGFTPSACQTCEQTRSRVRLVTQGLPLSRMSLWRLWRQSDGDSCNTLTDMLELHLRSHFIHPTLKCGCPLPICHNRMHTGQCKAAAADGRHLS